MTYIKGIVEGNIEQIKQQEINEDKVYIIKDLPENSITNEQMNAAVADNIIGAFYKVNNTFVCLDDGTYKKGHVYQWLGNAWEDITYLDPIDNVTITKNENGELQTVALKNSEQVKSADSIIRATNFIVWEDNE